jgi:hypothetical protein
LLGISGALRGLTSKVLWLDLALGFFGWSQVKILKVCCTITSLERRQIPLAGPCLV